jgi:hypothetical protein
MKKILVYFYGYKSKLLPEAVEQLIKNQSFQNDVHIVVYDQTNLSRKEKFNNVKYNHLHWDSLISRFEYMNLFKNTKVFDFFMYIDGAKMFGKNWDLELLKYQDKKNIILSGNHEIVFNKNNYKFYPEYNKIKIMETTKNNWFVKDFFFIQFDLFKSFPDISIFKYYGVEEYISMYAAYNDISIVALPTNYIVDQEPDIKENDFVPFSLYHNYSKIIDCFKSKNGSMPGVKELMSLVDYDFYRLEYFPYNTNDVEYTFFSNLDNISQEKFHIVQKEIY